MTAALIVSIIALVLSVASLGWQAWSWRRTGPVVTVETAWAYAVGPQMFEMLTITARNRGRSPVQVTNYSFTTPHGMQFVVPDPIPFSTPLKQPLEGGHEATYYFDAAYLKDQCRQRGLGVGQLRPRVTLGTGKQVVGRKGPAVDK